jgi:hypothetical protein
MKTLVILGAALVALVGCTQPMKSAEIVPGKPFVVLRNVDPACVHSRLVDRMAARGWTAKSISDTRMVAERKSPPWLNTAALASGYESPLVRMTLMLVPAGRDMEIVIDPAAVTNPGMSNERVEPIEATAEMQATFNDAAQKLEEYCVRK